MTDEIEIIFIALCARSPGDAIETTEGHDSMHYLVELTTREREMIPAGYARVRVGAMVEDEHGRGTWVLIEKKPMSPTG